MSDSPRIRSATPADYAFYARLFPDLLTPEDPPPAAKFAVDVMPHAFVLEENGETVGLAYVNVLDGLGYVRQVLVDGAHRGRGHGRRLMLECARRFAAEGVAEWCLNVRLDNSPAVRLYRSLGMSLQYGSTSVRIDWSGVSSLPDPSGTVSTPTIEDARSIEAAFALPGGLIRAQIEHPQRVVRACTDAGGAVCGVASFDPTFPGCFPFRAKTPANMRALLDGLRPSARPEHHDIQLVFEDAPELAAALERAGGRRTMEFVHFRGDLPEAGAGE